MMLRIERFAGSEAEWDGFARSQPGYTHFHRLRWSQVIRRALGHECVYLSARDESGELAGVLPLVRVRSSLFGHYLVSMPFVNYGGPLGSGVAVRALVAEACELARSDGVRLLELRSRAPLEVALPVSHRKITVLLDLPGDADTLFRRFDAKLRSQIRKPQKAGVKMAFGRDQVRPFFDVFSRHMRDLGTPTHSLAFFESIAESFPDDCWFGCAYVGRVAVAGGCGFRFGNEFEMTWASSLREYNRDAPNMLLYWTCMQRAIDDGASSFNFGRCTPGGGTHRFKQQWGGRDEPLWWYALSESERATVPSHNEAYAWGPRLWRKLPLPIATALGPTIVRCLP